MKFQLDGIDYLVKFHHSVGSFTTSTLYRIEGENLRVVTYKKDEDEVLTVGTAFCHWKDNFSRKIGRKLAFTKLVSLMKSTGLISGTRERIKFLSQSLWHLYFEEFPKDRS